MRIDVRPILYTPGRELPFRFALDLSDLDFGGQRPIARPVEVEGRVRNRAEALELELTAHTTLQAVCDRCGTVFDREKEAAFACALTQGQTESDEVLPLDPEGGLDVGALAQEVFILSMDTKTLCSEDCRGLCQRCGANLNFGPCGCQKEPDPRLAALARLLTPQEGTTRE